jgi:hypothetical protein
MGSWAGEGGCDVPPRLSGAQRPYYSQARGPIVYLRFTSSIPRASVARGDEKGI